MSVLKFLPPWLKEKLRRKAGAITVTQRLENLRRAGFRPRLAIDAGAFEGEWTKQVKAIFPSLRVLMIEPQKEKEAALRRLAGQSAGLQFRGSLLGAEPGRACFLSAASNSRILSGEWRPATGGQFEERAVETLAHAAAEEGFSGCDFLKLDLQGHELAVLKGAGRILGQCEVLWVEVSWLPIGNPPLAHEVIAYCLDHGYRLYDVLGHNYRPLDGALWQTDFVFCRQDSDLISNPNWA